MLYVAHHTFTSQHQVTSEYPSVPSAIQCRALRTNLEKVSKAVILIYVSVWKRVTDWQLSAEERVVNSASVMPAASSVLDHVEFFNLFTLLLLFLSVLHSNMHPVSSLVYI